VRATLWGRPGLTREVVALLMRPRGMRMIPKSSADDFSASRRGSE